MMKKVVFSILMAAFCCQPFPSFSLPVKPTDLLVEVKGNIYPHDLFPQNCQGILQGARCSVESYGHYHLEMKKQGELVYNHVTFSGPEGTQVIEDSWEKNGKVQKAIIENRAIGKRSQLEVKNGKVFYEVTDLKDQSVKKSEDLAEDNLVVPSTIMNYISNYREQISKGENLVLKIAVLDRRDSFTFKVKKIKDGMDQNGEPIQVLEMAPASFIVKAAVDPMYFYIKSKSGQLFAFEGESGLRRKVGNSYEKMKVRTAYEYTQFDESPNPKKKTAVKSSDCEKNEVFNPKNPMKCEIKQ
jgi:hypothetical protein